MALQAAASSDCAGNKTTPVAEEGKSREKQQSVIGGCLPFPGLFFGCCVQHKDLKQPPLPQHLSALKKLMFPPLLFPSVAVLFLCHLWMLFPVFLPVGFCAQIWFGCLSASKEAL